MKGFGSNPPLISGESACLQFEPCSLSLSLWVSCFHTHLSRSAPERTKACYITVPKQLQWLYTIVHDSVLIAFLRWSVPYRVADRVHVKRPSQEALTGVSGCCVLDEAAVECSARLVSARHPKAPAAAGLERVSRGNVSRRITVFMWRVVCRRWAETRAGKQNEARDLFTFSFRKLLQISVFLQQFTAGPAHSKVREMSCMLVSSRCFSWRFPFCLKASPAIHPEDPVTGKTLRCVTAIVERCERDFQHLGVQDTELGRFVLNTHKLW